LPDRVSNSKAGAAWRNAVDILLPVIGLGLVIFYQICDTACSALRGKLLGVDLKVVGILFMASLLAIAALQRTRLSSPAGHLRTLMLAGALGGEVLLVRFQIVHETYCPFCLAFGLCIVLLFAAHFPRMNKYAALAAFLAGAGVFALGFTGSVLPLYG